MKFSTGDDVTIRKDLSLEDATAEMCMCRGENATVTYCSGSYYKLDIDKGEFNWTDNMLE